jgi:hypothetical protein
VKKSRLVSFALLSALSISTLTACALIPLSAAEQSYVDDCKRVQANFNDYIKIQDEIYDGGRDDPRYDWKFWPGGSYLVTNAGQASRDTASSFIKTKFPWIYSATENHFKDFSKAKFLEDSPKMWSFDYEASLNQEFFRILAEGTNFEITSDSLEKLQDEFYSIEVDKVFALYAPSDRFQNCDEALGLKDEESFDSLSNYYGLSSKAVNVSTVLEVSIGLWGCETLGVGYIEYGTGWEKCAKNDYVEDVSDNPTSSEPTEEELEILAEREQNAERDSQNPSTPSYSNVSPLQLCSSAGVVVQTEKYGELTCGFFWVNRVRTLIWMRP